MAAAINTGTAAETSAKVTTTLKPEATRFTNKAGQVADFYFTNNPWKISPNGSTSKVYKYCVVCSKERFSNDKWAVLDKYLGFESPLFCLTYECRKIAASLADVVPKNHWSVITQFDSSRVKANKLQEHFEKNDEVVSVVDFDRESYDKKLIRDYFVSLESNL